MFGNTTIPTGAGDDSRRLPRNSRFANPAAITVNAAVGIAREGWHGELFIDNLGNAAATAVQVGGRYMPVVTKRRPRTLGVRLAFER